MIMNKNQQIQKMLILFQQILLSRLVKQSDMK